MTRLAGVRVRPLRVLTAALPLVVGLGMGGALLASPPGGGIRAPGGLSCVENGVVQGMHVHGTVGAGDTSLWAATPEAAIASFVAADLPLVDAARFREAGRAGDQARFVLRSPGGDVLASAVAFQRPLNGWAVGDLWVCASLTGPVSPTTEVAR